MTDTDFFTDGPEFADETRSGGDGLLRINWYNGDIKAKTPGAFFVEDDRLERSGYDAPGKPWAKVERTFNDGSTKSGYGTPGAKIAVIGWRQQDAVHGADGRIERFLDGRTSKAGRPDGWTCVVEVLCLMDGFGMQPVVWRSNRIKSSMAFLLNITLAFDDAIFRDAKAAARQAGRQVYRWSFWMPIRGAKGPDGQPVFEKTQGQPVTPPALILPEGKTGRELWSALYSGPEIVKRGIELRTEWDAWFSQPIGSNAAQAQPSGRNVPQPVEDEALPF